MSLPKMGEGASNSGNVFSDEYYTYDPDLIKQLRQLAIAQLAIATPSLFIQRLPYLVISNALTRRMRFRQKERIARAVPHGIALDLLFVEV